MLALKNSTPFAAHYVLLPNEQGIDTLYVNVKATYDIGPEWILSQPQPAPVGEDIYWGAPGQSSLKYPSDVHPGKRGTDIAVLGSAWAAVGKAVRQLDVALAIGPCKKSLRVFGDRFWRQGRITPPEAFTEMPICYENASAIPSSRARISLYAWSLKSCSRMRWAAAWSIRTCPRCAPLSTRRHRTSTSSPRSFWVSSRAPRSR